VKALHRPVRDGDGVPDDVAAAPLSSRCSVVVGWVVGGGATADGVGSLERDGATWEFPPSGPGR